MDAVRKPADGYDESTQAAIHSAPRLDPFRAHPLVSFPQLLSCTSKWLMLLLFVAVSITPSTAQEVELPTLQECELEFVRGEYQKVIEFARRAIKAEERDETWYVWKIRAEMTLGRYADARKTLEAGLEIRSSSVRLRYEGHWVDLYNGDRDAAKKRFEEIEQFIERSPWKYTSARDRVTVGRAAIVLGLDPRRILEFYDRAKRQDPKLRDVYLAIGDLGLEKGDDETAASAFREGLEQHPNDADLHFGLARAFSSSSSEKASVHLQKAIESNPNHLPSLLFQIDNLIDAENYDDAGTMLDHVFAINPSNPEGWAYRAVIAHLRGDREAEENFRKNGLQHWSGNPKVDHLIGRKLSQKYRFQEGAGYQRIALAFDKDFLPAKTQLAQDLLRLGEEKEGWQLANQAHEQDPYDIASFNLVTLHDNLSTFETLETTDFILRMDRQESVLYGDRVLDLLTRAKRELCEKYGLEILQPVTVEIFPDQSDFAVRTFGMPGGAGFLGVCFGSVITANSPASQGESPSNWESVLWHEFCHVVTLQLTHNKMPRWLSEGISVYEELQKNPSWGQTINPVYRKMILDGEMAPVSRLSSMFLSPPTPLHLQFAYFQSALVVEFLVAEFGIEAMRAILTDLAGDVPINKAIEQQAKVEMEEIETRFETFAHERAESIADGVSFDRDEFPDRPTLNAIADWSEQHPDNFWGVMTHGRMLAQAKRWEQAEPVLKQALELYPGFVENGNAYVSLASLYRERNDVEAERSILQRFVDIDSDVVPSRLRLIELCEQSEDWDAVENYADQVLGINPLIVQPYRSLAKVAEQHKDAELAVRSYDKLVRLGSENPADTHYRLGYWMYQLKNPRAKRHILMALEYAPRFPDALRFLLTMQGDAATQEEDTDRSDSPKSKEGEGK